MSSILVIAEHDGEQIGTSTAKSVRCALQLGTGAVHVAVFSNRPGALAGQAAQLQGVDHVIAVGGDHNANALAATMAPQIAALASGYSHVLAPATTFGRDIMPRAAALLGVVQVTDIMAVVDARTFKRPVYANNAIVTVRVPGDGPVVGTVRSASWAAVDAAGAPAEIEERELDVELPTHTRYVGLEAQASDRPDLQTARRVVSGGRALGEQFEMIYGLADRLGAAVGASRAAVDAGYVPNDMQVGQTGKIIAPDLYIAIGISGAIQHLTGIRDAGTIVAINKDEDAPIFEVADYGLVGDLFEIVPQLERALGE